jgi:molybdopterin molybdotransferase
MREFQTAAGGPPISVAEAERRVLAEVELIDTEVVAINDADERVLREEIIAVRPIPGRDNSAVDGYAVRADDIAAANETSPASLRVLEDLQAGRVTTTAVVPGTAIRIMTGAPVPPGADAVVPFEQTDAGTAEVAVRRSFASGANIRRAGEDVMQGDRVLLPGSVLGAGEIGVLAMLQRATIEVSRKPTVAILATGSEVVDIAGQPATGEVVNSNSYALASLVRRYGGIPRLLGIVPDDRQATIDALRNALESDFIISSGGVSVGAYDFVREAIEGLGGQILFWRVAMKPGKPVLLARIGGRLHFGLPGNPVSCLVSFHLFVGPALRKATGCRDVALSRLMAHLTSDLRSSGDRTTFLRVALFGQGGELMASPMARQGSGVATSMVSANGLAIMEEGAVLRRAGERIEVLVVDSIRR